MKSCGIRWFLKILPTKLNETSSEKLFAISFKYINLTICLSVYVGE
jgi:hypothetical protein